MPTKNSPRQWGGGYSDDTLYFTTEFSCDTELNTGRIYLGGTLVGKPSVWEEMPEPKYLMVDLGLPSGLKWADRNVGAESPEAYGDYFAWGETAPRGDGWEESAPYDYAHCPFNNGSEDFDEAYFSANSGTWLTEDGTLKPEYDAAHVNMGGTWRMPTSGEIQELIDGTTQSVKELNGISCMRFTSNANGNSIFMPFGGYRDGSYDTRVDYEGFAWSSSLDSIFPTPSFVLNFFSDDVGAYVYYNDRCYGTVVRGVCQ